MKFKPQLCPNEKTDLNIIKYPFFESDKLDGIRFIFHPKLGMVTRSLKTIPNLQLRIKFQPILDYCKKYNLILDGEAYSPNRTFQEITRAVMTQDFTDVDTIKKIQKELGDKSVSEYVLSLLNDVEFYCFDVLNLSIENSELLPFKQRYAIIESIELKNFNPVKQIIVNSKEEVEESFEKSLKYGNEGLILKDPNGRYKFGRGTIKEGLCFKVKPFESFDAKIIGVEERMENTNKSFKNELGQSVKRNTVDRKEPTGIASVFIVEYNGLEVKPVITGSEEFRKEIWNNQSNYIGKMIEYKGMLVGSKDKPRHPTFLRFREDRD